MAVTLVLGGEVHEVDGVVRGDAVLVTGDALQAVTGWALRPEGLCREDVCIPYRAAAGLVVDDLVDVEVFGAAVRRAVAAEPRAAIAVISESADHLAASVAEGAAAPFTLPDLDGNPVSLRDFAGRKKLLLAWSSW